MSFSSDIKNELVRVKVKTPVLQLCELSGLMMGCGGLYISRSGRGAVCTTEALCVGKRIASLADGLYRIDSVIELTAGEQRRRPLAVTTLTGAEGEKLLLDTGLLICSGEGLSLAEKLPPLPEDEEARRGFLRGMFLGCGSCTNPRRGYHLELVTRAEGIAEGLVALIGGFSITAHAHRRKDKAVVYCKGEEVTAFLALLGANLAAMEFENVRAEKDFRNYVNRTSNCETANIGKTVDAGLMQLHAIEVIEQTMDLSRLPGPLYEAALLRLGHPDATLQELADLAEIGKSGMNHRLSRLLKLAEEIEHG